MKTLSILQPWASLIVREHKRIETRSWNTKHRGPILIHASKARAQVDILGAEFARHYNSCGMWHEELPYSSIIGITNLIATSTTECLRAFTNLSFTSHAGKFEMPGGLTEQEYIFGDYSRGRYGWLLSDTLIFEEPIPCKGKLGLWTPDESTMAKVNHQISLI